MKMWKALVGAFNKEKAPSRSLLHDCEFVDIHRWCDPGLCGTAQWWWPPPARGPAPTYSHYTQMNGECSHTVSWSSSRTSKCVQGHHKNGSVFAAASCRLIKCIRLPSGHETITANAANMPLPAGCASAAPAILTVRAKMCSE